MMDSEKRELRKIKTKRLLIWTVGITALTALVAIFIIFGLLSAGSS
jgi:hypothetical protein